MLLTAIKQRSKVKSKVKAVAKVSPVKQDLVRIEEAYCKMLEAKSEFEVAKREYDGLMGDFIISHGEDIEAHLLTTDSKTIRGIGEYDLEIGPVPKSRQIVDNKITMRKLEKVREGLGWECVSFRLGDLDRYLTPRQMEQVVKTIYSGSRRYTLVKK